MVNCKTDILIVGAGQIGIAAAYYLKKRAPQKSALLVDQMQPLAFTSAQSGENYRNWWPTPIMRAFTERSIDLMEEIAATTDNRIQLNRRGYVLATRQRDISAFEAELAEGYTGSGEEIRKHSPGSQAYQPVISEEWRDAPSGVDILRGSGNVKRHFPYYADDVETIIHIRRGGMLSGQQMGTYMLEKFREAGGKLLQASVHSLDKGVNFTARLDDGQVAEAGAVVNAAGPFLNRIAGFLGFSLPVSNWFQQKIAFEDREGVIDRTMPFTIDLDPQYLDWVEDERVLLAEDENLAWLAGELPGAVHCRPEGGEKGKWVKMGWAYNQQETEATFEPVFDRGFPEIVLRGAARLHPGLKTYYGRLPRAMSHYGGFYTLTKENWPLIGSVGPEGFFVVGAMSGFGTMAACAAGELLTKHVLGEQLLDYEKALAPSRYENPELVKLMESQSNRGIL